MDLYAHVLPERLSDAAHRVDALLALPSGQPGGQTPNAGSEDAAKPIELSEERVVSLNSTSWNRIREWLTLLDASRRAA